MKITNPITHPQLTENKLDKRQLKQKVSNKKNAVIANSKNEQSQSKIRKK